jgi:Flp pilus assembly pilin Flp
MNLSELRDLHRVSPKREEGQTMAEYGVVLSVITLAVVTVFTLLSGGVIGAINKVIGLLPT